MIHAIVTYFQNSFSTPMQTVGQCIGFVAMLLSLVAFSFVSRKRILVSKLIIDLLWVVGYFLCGATSGAVTNIVSTARETVFYFKKDSWKRRWWIPALFMSFYVGSALVAWDGVISLLPLIASILSVLGLWATRPLHTKLVLLPSLILWLCYSLYTYSIMAVISNVFALISVGIGLWREICLCRRQAREGSGDA